MAWPRCVTLADVHGSGSFEATSSCARTRSRPVTCSVTAMLDLQPRVHLEEVEALGAAAGRRVDEELDRAGVAVAAGARRADGRLGHPRAQARVGHGRRALFDDLLMPALHRALALEQMYDVAVVVGEDLHLDVPRPRDQPLDVERAVAERRRRFAARRLNRLGDVAVRLARGACPCRRRRPTP